MTTSSDETKTPTFARAVSNCNVHQNLYFLDVATNNWIDFDGNESDYPFVTFVSGENTANADIGKITVNADRTLTPTSLWKPSKLYKAKLVLSDPLAIPIAKITYEFDIELRDVCADNSLTKTAELDKVTTYIIGSGDKTLTPKFTESVSGESCTSDAKLEFIDPATSSYVVDNDG